MLMKNEQECLSVVSFFSTRAYP